MFYRYLGRQSMCRICVICKNLGKIEFSIYFKSYTFSPGVIRTVYVFICVHIHYSYRSNVASADQDNRNAIVHAVGKIKKCVYSVTCHLKYPDFIYVYKYYHFSVLKVVTTTERNQKGGKLEKKILISLLLLLSKKEVVQLSVYTP